MRGCATRGARAGGLAPVAGSPTWNADPGARPVRLDRAGSRRGRSRLVTRGPQLVAPGDRSTSQLDRDRRRRVWCGVLARWILLVWWGVAALCSAGHLVF